MLLLLSSPCVTTTSHDSHDPRQSLQWKAAWREGQGRAGGAESSPWLRLPAQGIRGPTSQGPPSPAGSPRLWETSAAHAEAGRPPPAPGSGCPRSGLLRRRRSCSRAGCTAAHDHACRGGPFPTGRIPSSKELSLLGSWQSSCSKRPATAAARVPGPKASQGPSARHSGRSCPTVALRAEPSLSGARNSSTVCKYMGAAPEPCAELASLSFHMWWVARRSPALRWRKMPPP